LRERLRDECVLEEVWDLSAEGVFPGRCAYPVVLVARRRSPAAAHVVRLLGADGEERGAWPRRAWLAAPDALVPLAADSQLGSLAAAMFHGPRLGEHARFRCGIAISGFGRAVGRGPDRILRARDVGAFHTGGGCAFDARDAGIAVATSRRQQVTKILVPGMFRRLCASFDARARLLGRVYYTPVNARDPRRTLLLALLNSRLYAVLYAGMFAGGAQSGGWLRANSPCLAALPWPSRQPDAALATCVRKLERGDDAVIRARLDRLVEDLFGLDTAQRAAVACLARNLPVAPAAAPRGRGRNPSSTSSRNEIRVQT